MAICKPVDSEYMTPEQLALHVARHELVTLHGLIAADGAAPQEAFVIDTREAVALIDEALTVFENTSIRPS